MGVINVPNIIMRNGSTAILYDPDTKIVLAHSATSVHHPWIVWRVWRDGLNAAGTTNIMQAADGHYHETLHEAVHDFEARTLTLNQPLVKGIDPEFEALLAEEEEIRREGGEDKR